MADEEAPMMDEMMMEDKPEEMMMSEKMEEEEDVKEIGENIINGKKCLFFIFFLNVFYNIYFF